MRITARQKKWRELLVEGKLDIKITMRILGGVRGLTRFVLGYILPIKKTN